MDAARLSITIIGSGNVATNLALALARVCKIDAVCSRNLKHANELRDKVEAIQQCVLATDRLDQLPASDIYIISVPDDAIADVVCETAAINDGIWAHTSGSVPMDVFAGMKKCYGVFYPLQTFSKARIVDMKAVPMFIEGCNAEVAQTLVNVADMISDNVKLLDSSGRQAIHVAAVFACNFTNYMWRVADDLLNEKGLDISVLKPLIQETVAKLDELSPEAAQTGPARRGDLNVIAKHLAALENSEDPSRAEIYKLLSNSILKAYSND